MRKLCECIFSAALIVPLASFARAGMMDGGMMGHGFFGTFVMLLIVVLLVVLILWIVKQIRKP